MDHDVSILEPRRPWSRPPLDGSHPAEDLEPLVRPSAMSPAAAPLARHHEVTASVVVPLRNEAGNLAPLVADIEAAMASLRPFELVLVDDASTDATLPERVEAALVTASFGRRVWNSLYRKYGDVSEQVASRDLKKLTDLGLLVARGERRGRVYVGSEQLLALRRSLAEARFAEDPFTLAAKKQPKPPGR